MSDPLATYLHDHLAGARAAIQILKTLQKEEGDSPLGGLATDLLYEIEADRQVLRGLADRVSDRPRVVKEAAARVGELASRLKLRHDLGSGLGNFLALEILAIGIEGKHGLWRALQQLADDERVRGLDLDALIRRARDQHARVEAFRLRMAPGVFAREHPPENPVGSDAG